MKNEIEKFDKYLKKMSKNRLNALGEVGFILLSLMKKQADTNMQPLINRITAEQEFESIEKANMFLKTYFDFHNKFINYTSAMFMIEDEEKFAMRIENLVTYLLKSVPIQEQKKFIVDFVDMVYDEVFEEFAFSIAENEDPAQSMAKATKIFGSEGLAFLFYSLIGITHELEEDKSITTQKQMTELATPIFVFLLALNEQRKNQFLEQSPTEESQSANNSFYNVGRNDPCPCGSGRKYKKCCLNKNERKSDAITVTEKPSNARESLSEKEIGEFYNTWTKFFEFGSKIYSQMYDLKYKKSYIKDEHGRFTLDEDVIDSNLASDIRGFIAINFQKLSDEFQSTRASKKDKEIIEQMSLSYKFSKFYISSIFGDGSAVLFDTQSEISYFVHSLYDPLGIMIEPYQLFETTLLFYKGRIIADGIYALYNMQIGDNMKQMLQKSYEESSQNIQLVLSKNEVKHKIYQLKINIKGSKPNIWRKVQVPASFSFYGLHAVIQTLFDWHNSHLWEFITQNGSYLDEEEVSQGVFSEKKEFPAQKFSIEHVLKNEKDKMLYVYDFGDDWAHDIVLEKIITSDEELLRPKFISGKRAAPFEDCGGIYAYNEIVQAIENPTDESRDMLEEYGIEPFDTDYFDSKRLAKLLDGNG
ncbi:SEC-C metal-binding domain-containing protein [Sulfurimonas sp.]|uniref:IS1096 element passenger TnpR family protein n=1 Tax=Sulfurimonas sp. TaxID=2022749 RepID=UPI001A00A49E|nr:SEC-C metal-binding domain-containing protein [Sulfurimonas sp.]MBE0514771.1 SEC-C domain-containing protein [Sulfurimonas sp.]